MKLEHMFSMFILLIVLSFSMLSVCNKQEVIATVTEKVVKNDNRKSKYLIFTDSEVLENTDSILRFKFNSSDIYSEIKVGSQYKFTVVGFRVPMFSMYRNIIRVKEI